MAEAKPSRPCLRRDSPRRVGVGRGARHRATPSPAQRRTPSDTVAGRVDGAGAGQRQVPPLTVRSSAPRPPGARSESVGHRQSAEELRRFAHIIDGRAVGRIADQSAHASVACPAFAEQADDHLQDVARTGGAPEPPRPASLPLGRLPRHAVRRDLVRCAKAASAAQDAAQPLDAAAGLASSVSSSRGRSPRAPAKPSGRR